MAVQCDKRRAREQPQGSSEITRRGQAGTSDDSITISVVEQEKTKRTEPSGINKAQLLSYMKLLDIPLGLVINFNELKRTEN